MPHTRRPISLAVSVALGIGAALLVLLASGRTAAAAPAPSGLNPPIPNHCFARADSNTLLVYSSADSAAVRQAVLVALPNDTIRLAGTCAGVAAQGGTTQTVLINKVLTLVGGYTSTNWVNSFPLTQPTTLDAQGAGRAITASADITVANLTVQHGHSFGGNGGGIFAGGNLTLLGAVNILSNTTLVSTTVANASAPARSSGAPARLSGAPGGNGGGAWGEINTKIASGFGNIGDPEFVVQFTDNSTGGNGGGLDGQGDVTVNNAQFSNNAAGQVGGGLNSVGTLHMADVIFNGNTATNAGGFYTQSGATIQRIICYLNIAFYGGGCWAAISENQVNGMYLNFYNNSAAYGAAADFYQVLAFITLSQFNANTGSVAGGAVNCVDADCNIFNSTFVGNIAPEGAALAGSRFLRVDPLVMRAIYDDVRVKFGGPKDSFNLLAGPTVLTGSALAASGVTFFVTDTIVASYTLAYETSQSGTIGGDYNLFDRTPVISGTNITTGTHSLVGNPLFADDLGHLSAGSPAINHGIDVGINVDLDGNHRPSGNGFDIGAYEFQLAKLFLPLVQR